MPFQPTRRHLLTGAAGLGMSFALPHMPILAQTQRSATDATFLFSCDVHACLVSADGLSPNCADEGKTDAALLKHVAAVNSLGGQIWPAEIDGKPSGLASAGTRIATPLGLVLGGDMTDDGGGQVKVPGVGRQLQQFASRYQQGTGPDRVHYPVYNGLGNHDLDQDGAPPQVDWYRRELRDYVELNHRSTVFYKAPVPVTNYDIESDNYSWDWGGLHLVQLQRFGGDDTKGALSGLPWLAQDLATYAADAGQSCSSSITAGTSFPRSTGTRLRKPSIRMAPAPLIGGATKNAPACSPRSRATISSASFTVTSTRRR